MAVKFLDDRIVTTQGLNKLGLITTVPGGNVYNTTWAAFLTNYGYNGGTFNIKGNWDNTPWGETRTYNTILRNGNYAKMIINKQGPSAGGDYDVGFSVELFDRNNVSTGIFINYAASTSSSSRPNFFDGALILIGYDDSTNRVVSLRFTKTANSNVVYLDRNDFNISYSVYIGWLLGALAPDDPYGLDENDTPSGGYGPWDFSSDDVLPPALPSVSAAQVGFVSLWNPSAQEMKDLADYLWTGTFDLTNFKKLFTDPMECVLSVGIVPVTPTTGTATEIIFGGSSHSGVNAKPITDQFVTTDMGSIHIEGKSASFMDYSPYAKASIFLPYCGTYALDVDEIMDADIDLEYHIDIYTGACVAYLTITRTNSDGNVLNSALYQFTGNVLATIPITGADHSAFLQSLLFMGASVAATVATAGAAAPEIGGAMAAGDAVAMSPAMTGIAAGSAINTVMSMKPNVIHSGNLSSTAGFLGQQKPFITMTWSNLCRPDDEQKLVGLPLYKSGTLSDFEGFTVVDAVHLDNLLCTDAEMKMIEQALYKGVIV